ncbi:HD domain-containing protein [Nocardioides donggukensis]|uniref:Metal-dependent phosphohydrolase n=1 Tax=Nocardioides donggukensis TaxID=2774019 RepID=A0A927PZP3_9ACTN|nr:hypothetical protein [Nocardioides donggukensis]MBD8870568.1 hypothetical protein [Nocardioides donggukensis]
MPLPWPLPDRSDLRDRLLEAYRRGRGYHDVRHLGEVLDRLHELGASENRDLILAAWYHDAVYDAAGDNEDRSARLAQEQLAGTGADGAEVARLVRLTKSHDPAPGDADGEALCDADLAILAAGDERYAEYVAGVRAEYAHIPDADFARGRAAILEELLGHGRLFRTAHGQRHWEQPARSNLARELEELRRQAG